MAGHEFDERAIRVANVLDWNCEELVEKTMPTDATGSDQRSLTFDAVFREELRFTENRRSELQTAQDASKLSLHGDDSSRTPNDPADAVPHPMESASLRLMLNELAGKTGADGDYVYLSDGGHFENTGAYELIRRRCRFIVVVDAGSDPNTNENMGRLVRLARIDFGVNIEMDMSPIVSDVKGNSLSHVTVGRIQYGHRHKPAQEQDYADPSYCYRNNQGIIVWIKNTMTGDEPADLRNFRAMHPEFPFDSTLNQFFSESRFESYRKLGFHSVFEMLKNIAFRDSSPTNGSDAESSSIDANSSEHHRVVRHARQPRKRPKVFSLKFAETLQNEVLDSSETLRSATRTRTATPESENRPQSLGVNLNIVASPFLRWKYGVVTSRKK